MAAVLEANSDHPGLQQVLTFLTTFMAKAAHDSQAFRGAADVARLVSHGVTDRRVLEELCAAWAFMAWRPHALPSDAARDYLLARAVFALAPRPRRPCGKAGPAGFAHSYGVKPSRSALAYVGGHLRRALSPFLVNVYGQIERDRQQKTDPSAALMAPLRSSVTASPSGLPFPG